jgi:translation initiation factor 2 subunit 3
MAKKTKDVAKELVEEAVNSKSKSKNIQPVINIGLVGHVDHGKTTLTEKLSGKWTDTHSEELKRGITIRLGYADVEVYKCPKCDDPKCYSTKKKCPYCASTCELVRRISLVDAPGHESLMATMLSGTNIMDGALLLVAANETCPQPQTREHLMALEVSGIKNIIVIQNKIDLVSKDRVKRNYEQIREFLSTSRFKDAPIIPISAQHDININWVIKAIEHYFPTPNRDTSKQAAMHVARSFDINKPGCAIDKLKGGVLGGSVQDGIFEVGDEIEIRPGRIENVANQLKAFPIKTKITSIITGGKPVKEVFPGGSMAMMTELDPSIVKSDSLTGNIVGHVGKLPEIRYNLKLKVHLLERIVGAKEDKVVDPLRKMEVLMLNINSASTVGFVTSVSKDEVECKLKLPVCADVGSNITISRRVGTRFRLIGYGIVKE